MTSPPSYSASAAYNAYPQPAVRPASVRQRKSSTTIPIISDNNIRSPSVSPARSTARQADSASYDSAHSHPVEPNHYTFRQPPTESSLDRPYASTEHVEQRKRRSSDHSSMADAEEGEASPLLGEETVPAKWHQSPFFVAGWKFCLLFIIFTSIVGGTFYFAMPPLDPQDRPLIKLPKSFEDLQSLNGLFQKYKTQYPYRLMACGVVAYLFVQMFSLPGSMYISILFGAAYGMGIGLLLSCLCDAFGGCMCYMLSAVVAPPLLALPFYRARVETWRIKIMGDPKTGKQVSMVDVFCFLLVLRISPVPPHWVANFVAPHLGISVFLFWLSCFCGIAPISVIHVTIGSSLDTMTSAADFHLLSVRNILGLLAVIVAVLIPVALKRVFKKDIGELEEADSAIQEVSPESDVVEVPPVEGPPKRYQAVDSGVVLAGPSRGDDNLDTGKRKGKGRALEIIADVQEEDEDQQEMYMAPQPAVIQAEKRPMGYGTIEPVQRESVVSSDGAGPWWSFSSR